MCILLNIITIVDTLLQVFPIVFHSFKDFKNFTILIRKISNLFPIFFLVIKAML